MISSNPFASLKITDCSLFTRRVLVDENMTNSIQFQLERVPAQYNFIETIARTFIIPNNQNTFLQENVFNNAPIRRLAIAMNSNSAFTGSSNKNPFSYKDHGLREIRILRNGQPVIQMNTMDKCRPYVTTLKAMNFNEDVPSIPFEDFENHFILVFDLTSLQDANEEVYYPELVGGSIRIELYFKDPVVEVTELIILGERLSTVQIDKFGTVAKNN